MKKLTERRKAWFLVRQRRQAKKSHHAVTVWPPTASRRPRSENRVVVAWGPNGKESVLCTGPSRYPPDLLCLTENRDETLKFLDWLKKGMAIKLETGHATRKVWIKRFKGKRLPEIATFTDFSRISRISAAAAVAMAAEYDRARRIMNDVPPTINLEEWSAPAIVALFEIGFFGVVGLSDATKARYRDSVDGDVRMMQMISGTNATELRKVSEEILELSQFIGDNAPPGREVSNALSSALGEAMVNVANHAYPDDFLPEQQHVGQWWVAASADRRSRRLNVVVYDQGATIPATLPKRQWAREAVDAIKSLIVGDTAGSDVENLYDHHYIEYAMRDGTSQTKASERGLGLPQMREFVDICGNGSLTILSRNGQCRYDARRGLTMSHLAVGLSGTLIEWEMVLPKVEI